MRGEESGGGVERLEWEGGEIFGVEEEGGCSSSGGVEGGFHDCHDSFPDSCSLCSLPKTPHSLTCMVDGFS